MTNDEKIKALEERVAALERKLAGQPVIINLASYDVEKFSKALAREIQQELEQRAHDTCEQP